MADPSDDAARDKTAPSEGSASEREARLAAALRANLRRRKAPRGRKPGASEQD